MRKINLFRLSCFAIIAAFMLTGNKGFSQTIPTIYVDGSEIMASNFLSGTPVWLAENQTLAIGTKVVSVNVIQFIKVSSPGGGYSLEFDTPLLVTSPSPSPSTVPANKVWKIESVGLDKTASSSVGDNLGNHVATTDLNMSDFKINNVDNPANLKDAVNTSTVQKSALVYAADAGAVNAYSVTLSPAPASYTEGMIITFKAANTNTGAATLNVNGLGAITIKKQGTSADVSYGDIAAGQMITVIYDGTYFEISGQLSNPSGGAPHGKQLFTSNGTFNVPQAVTTVWVTISGGGGGGAYGSGSYGGGGGGGGAAYIAYQLSVTPLTGYAITIGNAGSGSGSGNGTAGGNSSFGALLTANGGGGGIATTGVGGAAGGAGATNGGHGINGGSWNGGDGGSSIFGAGGIGGYSATSGGLGSGYGAGGGGSAQGTGSGANGSPGFVLVEW